MKNNESEKDKQQFNVTVNLLLKYYRGKTDSGENSLIQQWLDQNEVNKLFLEKISDKQNLKNELEAFGSPDMGTAWENIAARTTNPKKEINFWTSPQVLKYAASITLILLITVFTLFQNKKATDSIGLITQKPQTALPAIKTDGHTATLIFADGSYVVLQDQKNGIIKESNGTRVIKQNDQIIFQSDKTARTGAAGNNILSTQSGVQYQIVLTDGSKIWLNAASTLRFPTAFTKKERLVELEGEGYFEVAKNKAKPFKVKANKTMVTVLGTHFNIMSYKNEKTTNTTLLEGSVKVCDGTTSKILIPGQQARVNDKIEVTAADLEEATAWKNGNFQFNNTELGTIMRQIERWYNIKIDYNGEVAEKHFTGIISRTNTITNVLKMLELSSGINFKIEERRIIVSSQEDEISI